MRIALDAPHRVFAAFSATMVLPPKVLRAMCREAEPNFASVCSALVTIRRKGGRLAEVGKRYSFAE